jgi:polyketide biosynthesis enoyl-CoA hydratase PksI
MADEPLLLRPKENRKLNVINVKRENDILYVSLEEKEEKNMFTRRLTSQLMGAFADIESDRRSKVVVVSGYGSYFCSGGTQKELIDILEGRMKFNDINFYDLLLRCKLPVIAAMQGHGLGGGLVFGAYADIVILSRRHIYSTNFMQYGFTPGMGATLIIPQIFGSVVGNEMLYSANRYSGAALQQRNVNLTIVNHDEVLSQATEMAEALANKPQLSLILLKERLVRKTREALPEYIASELEMHEKTFSQPEVRERIDTLFGQ